MKIIRLQQKLMNDGDCISVKNLNKQKADYVNIISFLKLYFINSLLRYIRTEQFY